MSKVKFVATFNPALPGVEGLIKKHVHYLDSDEVLKKVFPNEKFSVINKRKKNLKEMVAPSLYPKPSIKSNRTIVSCNKSDICKNFLITDSKFRCTVTGKTYFIKSNLSCDSCNVIYLITCFICREQYVVPAINIKQRFRIHNLILRLTKIVVRLQSILIINVAALIINMLIQKYRLLNRYLIIISLV